MPPKRSKRRRLWCVGTGFIVLDVVRNSEGRAATEKRSAGGSCGNVLSILGYLGWGADAIGRIGDDHVGREVVADLSQWSVGTRFLRMEMGRGTPVVVQENYLDGRGQRRHRFHRACPMCGATLPAYRPLPASEAEAIAASLPNHAAFYFDRVAPGTLKLAQRSRERGSLVVFEPSGVKDVRLFAACLRASHIVKYANDRLGDIHAVVARSKVPVEIETFGAEGLRVRVRVRGGAGGWRKYPAFSVSELCDAAGAGDWTTAGLIHGLMRTHDSADDAVEDVDAVVLAIRKGQALAALNCGFEGARGIMYVADSRRVLDSAESITIGTSSPSVEAAQLRRFAGRNGGAKACLSCSGARGLHL